MEEERERRRETELAEAIVEHGALSYYTILRHNGVRVRGSHLACMDKFVKRPPVFTYGIRKSCVWEREGASDSQKRERGTPKRKKEGRKEGGREGGRGGKKWLELHGVYVMPCTIRVSSRLGNTGFFFQGIATLWHCPYLL